MISKDSAYSLALGTLADGSATTKRLQLRRQSMRIYRAPGIIIIISQTDYGCYFISLIGMTRALFRPLRPRGSRIAQTRFRLLILSYLFLARAFLGRSFAFFSSASRIFSETPRCGHFPTGAVAQDSQSLFVCEFYRIVVIASKKVDGRHDPAQTGRCPCRKFATYLVLRTRCGLENIHC